VLTLGDALGFVDGRVQPTKLAAMEALWQTAEPPAPFNVVAWPNQEKQENDWELQIPYVLTPLITHTLDTPISGARELEQEAAGRIRNGIPAVAALKDLSADPDDADAMSLFRAHEKDLGYGFLVQRYAPDQDASKATEADIQKAARDVIPDVPLVFWSFRVMVGLGLLLLAYFVLAVIYSLRGELEHRRGFLRWATWMIPVPFLACETGWLVAEAGRQPWTVYEILPTWMSASTHSENYMIFSLTGFVLLYTTFIIIEMTLMVWAVRQGPSSPDQVAHETAGA
jgi:cytochrome bd ubiquinol oxidase subunit I